MTDDEGLDFSTEAMTRGPADEEGVIVEGCACGKRRHRFHFDEWLHRYLLDNKEIPGVTRISELCGLAREFNADAELGAASGTNQHKYIELFDKGQLGDYEIAPEAQATLDEWRQMREAFGIERYEFIEEPGFAWHSFGEESIHFAGTADRVYIAGPKHPCFEPGTRVYQDAKRSKDPKPQKLYYFKTALYAMIFRCQARELIYLRGTGKFIAEDIRRGGNCDWRMSSWDEKIALEALEFVTWRKKG